MKKFILFLLLSTLTFSSTIINPNSFKGSSKERKAVVKWIEGNVEKTYTAIGMGNASTLRMMEKEELKAFKQLTKVKNKKLLSKVIKTYTAVGMESYGTFLMMYNEEEKASEESLSW